MRLAPLLVLLIASNCYGWEYVGPPEREAEFRAYEMLLPECERTAIDSKMKKLIVTRNKFFDHYENGHDQGVTFHIDGVTIIDGRIPPIRLKHVFLHELWHHLDDGWQNPSTLQFFVAAVKEDCAVIPTDRDNYLCNPSEGFAEMGAAISVNDYGDGKGDFAAAYFPRTLDAIGAIINAHCTNVDPSFRVTPSRSH